MKARHSLLLTLVVATAVLVTFNHRCWAEQSAQQAPADINKPILLTPQLEPNEALIEAMMKRIANADPQRAEELEKLRQTNPEEFKKEIGKAMREVGYWRVKGRAEQKDQGRRRPHIGMPFEPAEGHGRESSAMMRYRQAEFLEWLQDNYPEQAEELAELREQNPQLYMRKLALSFETYGKIAEVARENPELAKVLKEDLELKKRRDSLLSRIKDTTDDKKKQQLVKELEEVVSARFDLIVERTRIRYEQLSKKLERLKEELKQSEAKVEKWKDPEFKKQNVKARLEKLLSETEKFSWE